LSGKISKPTLVPAPILDDDFYSQIENGQITFEHGDTITANLRRTITYDKVSGEVKKTKYQVIKVIQHDKSPQDDLLHSNYPKDFLG
jgi:hypothetical protein